VVAVAHVEILNITNELVALWRFQTAFASEWTRPPLKQSFNIVFECFRVAMRTLGHMLSDYLRSEIKYSIKKDLP
jgi:hypothetical protein